MFRQFTRHEERSELYSSAKREAGNANIHDRERAEATAAGLSMDVYYARQSNLESPASTPSSAPPMTPLASTPTLAQESSAASMIFGSGDAQLGYDRRQYSRVRSSSTKHTPGRISLRDKVGVAVYREACSCLELVRLTRDAYVKNHNNKKKDKVKSYMAAVHNMQQAVLAVIDLAARRHDSEFLNARDLLRQFDALVVRELYPGHDEWYSEYMLYMECPEFEGEPEVVHGDEEEGGDEITHGQLCSGGAGSCSDEGGTRMAGRVLFADDPSSADSGAEGDMGSYGDLQDKNVRLDALYGRIEDVTDRDYLDHVQCAEYAAECVLMMNEAFFVRDVDREMYKSACCLVKLALCALVAAVDAQDEPDYSYCGVLMKLCKSVYEQNSGWVDFNGTMEGYEALLGFEL